MSIFLHFLGYNVKNMPTYLKQIEIFKFGKNHMVLHFLNIKKILTLTPPPYRLKIQKYKGQGTFEIFFGHAYIFHCSDQIPKDFHASRDNWQRNFCLSIILSTKGDLIDVGLSLRQSFLFL